MRRCHPRLERSGVGQRDPSLVAVVLTLSGAAKWQRAARPELSRSGTLTHWRSATGMRVPGTYMYMYVVCESDSVRNDSGRVC